MNEPTTVTGRMLTAFLRGVLPEFTDAAHQIAAIEAEAAATPASSPPNWTPRDYGTTEVREGYLAARREGHEAAAMPSGDG